MKTREGFVSNSSTTSFTCQVSGCTEAYHDSCSMEDVGGSRCEKGHVFFSSYTLKESEAAPAPPEPEVEKDEDDEDYYENYVPARLCPICTGKHMNLDLVEAFLLKKLGWTKEQIWAEMQKLGKYEDMEKFIFGEE